MKTDDSLCPICDLDSKDQYPYSGNPENIKVCDKCKNIFIPGYITYEEPINHPSIADPNGFYHKMY
jgi:hypothetical protein